MRKKKKYDDDDGRVIADMSGVGRREDVIPGQGVKGGRSSNASDDEGRLNISRKERNMWIFGALRAGLLIALVYILGAVLIIGLILLIGFHGPLA